MAGKKEKRIKRKKPIAGWIVALLKLTQHISFCVLIVSILAVILEGSFYVDPQTDPYRNGGYRVTLLLGSESTSEKVSEHLQWNLRDDTSSAIRLATIRSQLETNGTLDLGKEISVSEYYYRRNNTSDTDNQKYFDAVYRLEDLLRWEKAGGLKYLNVVTRSGVENAAQWYTEAEEEEIEFAISELTGADDVSEFSIRDREEIIKNVDNMFLTVDGRGLEDLVSTNEEYRELCYQLAVCMSDLNINYDTYQYYMKGFAEGKTSFVYYIDMDNKNHDIFTNLSRLKTMSSAEVEAYFDSLLCAGKGTTSLYQDWEGNFAIEQEIISEYISGVEYAFGNNAIVYTGYDTNNGASDFYTKLADAYETCNEEMIYIWAGIGSVCAVYYIIVMIYLMYQSGRKIDEEGNNYVEINWIDTVYTEVFLVWIGTLGCGIITECIVLEEYLYYNDVQMLSIGLTALILTASMISSVLMIETLCSVSRRFKARTIWKNSLCNKIGWSFCKKVARYIKQKGVKMKQHARYYIEHAGLWERTWGIFFIQVVFFAVALLCMFIFAVVREEGLAICIGIILMAVISLIAYKRMRGKTERMLIIEKIQQTLAGENVKVETKNLSMDNAALGEAVNEIGEGMHQAVERSIKDERLKAELLTNVSHDIKTPLTSIINYVDLLKKENIESPKAAEYIHILDMKSQKLKTLIQDLIEASKISSGNIEYEIVPLKLHELIVQMVAEYEDKFQEHCLKIVYNNYVKDAVILADSRRMWRVMENLFSNIYKYALEGTRVYIEVTQSEDRILVAIKNISAKEINVQAEKLTERFIRGDASRNTEGGGLGLAIAQSLVVGQGGTLQILLDGDLFKVILSSKIQEI